ncbi:MAG: ABC transporter ATP-binding protein, partial [Firmicutes bacterium]|nr:ABC transporter ATP-binding protein [Bacillota bacterium]
YREHKAIRGKVSLVAPTADVGTDNNLTVRQNLEFWAVVYNLEKSRREARINEMLDFLDLRQYEGFWPMSISAGNRQKLAIARSLLVKNPILFLDEPTVKLDAKGAESVRALVKKINQEFGTTVILTTHYIFEAEELCGRVAIMHRGRIASCDTVENLRAHLQKRGEIILTCADGRVIRAENRPGRLIEMLKSLREQGISILAAETDEPTLEDIFVETIAGGEQ